MPLLVVAPRIVIASPTLGIAIDRIKLTSTSTNVANTFCFEVILYSGCRNNSSTVSLQGSNVRGVANKMTIRIPNNEM